MLATHLGFYNTASTRTHVRFQFSTHAAAGGNVAPNSAFEAADIRIYRANDGAAFSATQRSSANGITMTSPFDSLTGFHDVDIDLTDNTDAGFYASGYLYAIVLAPDETVDGQTLTGVVLAYFEIGPQPVNVTHFGGTAGTFSGGRPEVNTTLIEGSDATNQIRDAVVDDATRIDASALNTLSSHDPGETIMGATDLGTGSGLTSLATATELAKVPKSDSNVTWNATALASIQSEATDALNAYDPPTKAELDSAVSPLATAANLATVDDVVDAIKVTTDKLDDTLEDQGGGTYGFTEAALQEAPTGSGSGATAQEVWEYATRTLTAIDEDSTTLDLDATIRGAVGLASANLDTQLGDLPTAAENATAVWGSGTRSLTVLDEDSTTLDLDSTIRTAVGLASANLDTQLTAIDDLIDTEVGAIKAKTDQLTFTNTGVVDANITHVISDPVQENGADNTNWGGAV